MAHWDVDRRLNSPFTLRRSPATHSLYSVDVGRDLCTDSVNLTEQTSVTPTLVGIEASCTGFVEAFDAVSNVLRAGETVRRFNRVEKVLSWARFSVLSTIVVIVGFGYDPYIDSYVRESFLMMDRYSVSLTYGILPITN